MTEHDQPGRFDPPIDYDDLDAPQTPPEGTPPQTPPEPAGGEPEAPDAPENGPRTAVATAVVEAPPTGEEDTGPNGQPLDAEGPDTDPEPDIQP